MAEKDMTEKKTRTRRTPAQIAVQEYEAVCKRLPEAHKRVERTGEAAREALAELDRLTKRATYLSQNPDMPEGYQANLHWEPQPDLLAADSLRS